MRCMQAQSPLVATSGHLDCVSGQRAGLTIKVSFCGQRRDSTGALGPAWQDCLTAPGQMTSPLFFRWRVGPDIVQKAVADGID